MVQIQIRENIGGNGDLIPAPYIPGGNAGENKKIESEEMKNG